MKQQYDWLTVILISKSPYSNKTLKLLNTVRIPSSYVIIHTHARIPLCYRENFPVLVSKTPVLSEPSFEDIEKSILTFTAPFCF
jgi:hypothetical protein